MIEVENATALVLANTLKTVVEIHLNLPMTKVLTIF